jgi:oligosaccharyltransferase complex subunit gamma
VLLYFPAASDNKAEPAKYDFNRQGFEGSSVADFLSAQLGYKFPYSAPFPWGAVLTFSGACLVMAGGLLFVLPKLLAASSLSVLAASGAKFVCMAISLGTIIIMCAGHMWNNIRAPPYMQIGTGGRPEYFAQGFQNQYGAETHIIAAFCTWPLSASSLPRSS